MVRKCWRLQAQEMWLGLKVDKLFTTQKEADTYFQSQCIGTGIIYRVRATDETRKYYSGMDVTNTTKCKTLSVNER